MREISSFTFTISVAAVINGLGIVRILTGVAELLRNRRRFQVKPYWIYSLLLSFQFLLHILLWWAMYGASAVEEFNFIQYLYLLIGPILIFLATSLLLPDADGNALDLSIIYPELAPAYFTVISFMWLWAIFLWPVLAGQFAPSAPLLAGLMALAVALRLVGSRRAHAVLVPAYCLAIIIFILLFQIQIGGVGRIVNRVTGN